MRPKEAIRPEILAVARDLPRKQGLRVIREYALLQASATYLGHSVDELAYDVAHRAELEAGGPDAEPWQAFADLLAASADVHLNATKALDAPRRGRQDRGPSLGQPA